MAAYLENGELFLYGPCGWSWEGEGFTETEVYMALAEHGRDQDLTVRINSGGGNAWTGNAIYNQLKMHEGKVTVIVDSIALSAASLIAMAGDVRRMREGAMFMIHDPASWESGTSEDLHKAADILDLMAEGFAGIYASNSGNDPEDVRNLMKAETWYNGKTALEAGFATEIDQDKKRATMAKPFDFRMFANAPKALVQMAASKGWNMADLKGNNDNPAPEPVETEEPRKMELTEKELEDLKKQAVMDHKNRAAAIMALPGAKENPAQAAGLIDMDMTEEEAKAILAHNVKTPSNDAKDQTNEPAPADHANQRMNGAALVGGTAPEKSGKDAPAKMNATGIYQKRRKQASAA